jgi:hypothetical protein
MGIPTGQYCHFYNLLFAAYQLIIAQDTADAACMLRKLVEGDMKWGLQIHFGNTRYLTLDLGAEIMTGTGQIKTVNKFEYLVSNLESNNFINRKKNKRWKKGDWLVKICSVE